LRRGIYLPAGEAGGEVYGIPADYRRFYTEHLSPSLSPQEKGTDLDSIGILVGTRRKSLALRRGIYLPGSKAGGEVKIFFPQITGI
jgi:hypothetical protein